MKHKIVLLFFMLNIVVGFKTFAQECNLYEVAKIDSAHDYFLITIQKENKNFLIISPKKKFKNKKAIETNKSYYFKLTEHEWLNEMPENLIDIPHSIEIAIQDTVIWNNGMDYKLYETKNLKGLNYVKRRDCCPAVN